MVLRKGLHNARSDPFCAIFLAVLSEEKAIGHPVIKNLSHFRLAVYYHEQNNQAKLQTHLEQIDPTELSTLLQEQYQQLLTAH